MSVPVPTFRDYIFLIRANLSRFVQQSQMVASLDRSISSGFFFHESNCVGEAKALLITIVCFSFLRSYLLSLSSITQNIRHLLFPCVTLPCFPGCLSAPPHHQQHPCYRCIFTYNVRFFRWFRLSLLSFFANTFVQLFRWLRRSLVSFVTHYVAFFLQIGPVYSVHDYIVFFFSYSFV